MPTVTADFLNPHFFQALGHAVVNGLYVLAFISVWAAGFTFLTGGTAPRNWPKKNDAEPEAQQH